MDTTVFYSFYHKHLTFTRRMTENPIQNEFPFHSHGAVEIVFLKSGRLSYDVDGETVTLLPGKLIAIAPGVTHRVLPHEQTDYERYSAVIHLPLLPSGALDSFRKSYYLLHCAPGGELAELFERSDRIAHEFPEESHKTLFLALATELYYLLIRKTSDEHDTASKTVNRAISYIDSHYASICRVSEISDSLYLSKNYFHKLFRGHTGKTPLEYLTARRLHAARVRVIAGEKPTLVYKECGFNDYTSFYRSYKKQYRRSPSDLSDLEVLRSELPAP